MASSFWRKSRPFWLSALASIPIIYSLWSLAIVATTGDIGLSCVLGIELERRRSRQDRAGRGFGPWRGIGWSGSAIEAIDHYRLTSSRSGSSATAWVQSVEVEWRSKEGGTIAPLAEATVRRRPFLAYLSSLLWLLQEMAIFVVAIRVFWRRPGDESARMFFWLCIATVGAYRGGYHWTEIVIEPALIYLFAAFAVLVPVVSLHFYMVFPRINFDLRSGHRWSMAAGARGIPLFFIALRSVVVHVRRADGSRGGGSPEAVASIQALLADQGAVQRLHRAPRSCRLRPRASSALSASYRSAANRAERNQTYWILIASVLAILPIGYLLWSAWWEPARLGLEPRPGRSYGGLAALPTDRPAARASPVIG